MIEINYGSNIADTIITSPVVACDNGMDDRMQVDGAPAEGGAQPAPGASAGGNFAEYGGIDPNLDPELAMAIRISLEEAKNEDNADKKEGEAKPAEEQPAPAEGEDAVMNNEDKPAAEEQEVAGEGQEMEEDDDYEAALEEAKLLSMQGADNQPEAEVVAEKIENKPEEDLEGVINEEFLGELMQDLGVPMTDDAIKDCLEDDKKKDKKDEKDKDKKDDK